jgi:chemotaxis protein methyltransferase CheR
MLSAKLISLEQVEDVIDLVHKVYGFDFGGYSRASLKRRIARIMLMKDFTLFDLKSQIINDSNFFEEFLIEVTVNVTEMFRDPAFFKAVREKVFPYLSSYPRIKVWNAGCSSGEELYSFAILLAEEKLYNRSFLYGTDINSIVLESAKKGIYDLKKMKQNSENYIASGSIHTLANYYVAQYGAVSVASSLKKNTLFSIHNLVSDGVFNEFQIISCRNVLIYFTVELQEKVLTLFYESLCPLGFLCLGSKEVLRNDKLARKFRVIDRNENIYQKIE